MGSVNVGDQFVSFTGTTLTIHILKKRVKSNLREVRIKVIQSDVSGIEGIEVWLPESDILKHYRPVKPTWEV